MRDRRQSGCGVEDGDPQDLVSSLLLFRISIPVDD